VDGICIPSLFKFEPPTLNPVMAFRRNRQCGANATAKIQIDQRPISSRPAPSGTDKNRAAPTNEETTLETSSPTPMPTAFTKLSFLVQSR